MESDLRQLVIQRAQDGAPAHVCLAALHDPRPPGPAHPSNYILSACWTLWMGCDGVGQRAAVSMTQKDQGVVDEQCMAGQSTEACLSSVSLTTTTIMSPASGSSSSNAGTRAPAQALLAAFSCSVGTFTAATGPCSVPCAWITHTSGPLMCVLAHDRNLHAPMHTCCTHNMAERGIGRHPPPLL